MTVGPFTTKQTRTETQVVEWQLHLVFLAGGSRGLDQLLQDSQAHESDVLHHDRRLYVDRHEEQAEGC